MLETHRALFNANGITEPLRLDKAAFACNRIRESSQAHKLGWHFASVTS